MKRQWNGQRDRDQGRGASDRAKVTLMLVVLAAIAAAIWLVLSRLLD